MHALHVSALYWPHRGGAEIYLQEISERLVRDGNLVTVATSDAGSVESFWSKEAEHLDREEEIHNGVQIHRYPAYSLPGSPFSFYALRRLAMAISDLPLNTTPLLQRLGRYMPWMPTIERALDTLPASVSLVHGVNLSFEYPVIVAWRYARARGLPFVMTPLLHLGEPGERSVVRHHTMRHQLEALRGSEIVITLTNLEREYLIRLGMEATRVRKVGVGVNPCQLQEGDAQRFRERYGLRGQIVAFLGAITYDKGAVHLIRAMQQLWARGIDAELILAGRPLGSFKRYYEGLPKGVRRRITLLGSVDEAEKRDLLASAAVLAMPSRVDAFGIAYLEAWVNRKPVIGAWAGGVPEVIEDGEDGLLVPFGDIPRLVDSLTTLLADRGLARRLGERGYEKVMRRHTWDIVYQRIKAIYEELVG